KPVYIKQYRLPKHKWDAARDIINKNVQYGIMRKLLQPSSWNAPLVLVPKKDKSWRFCIDYRALNKVVPTDSYLTPDARHSLENLAGYCYFSAFDVTHGFWNILVDVVDQEKLAFTLEGEGQFTWCAMPMGL